MKKRFTFLLLTLFLTLTAASARDRDEVRLLNNRDTTIYVGDTLRVDVNARIQENMTGSEVLSLFVYPDSVGNFSGYTFKAIKPGSGVIRANYAGERDQFRINVIDSTASQQNEEDVEKEEVEHHLRSNIRILPKDTLVHVGSTIQYQAQLLNDEQVWVNTAVQWSLEGKRIGTITQDGKLEVTGSGIGYVIARSESGRAMTRIISEKTVSDTTNLNTIHILRMLPNGKVLPKQTIKEGGKFTIGGLPAPLNLLNGAKIYFPVGSLHEDISLLIKIPTFAKVDSTGTKIRYEKREKVLNAVSFEVYVNDQHIAPYYFDSLLNVTIPFKRGLLKEMGIDPTKLSLFYANDSLDLESRGISNIVVDTASNQIFSNVAHFSSFALTETSEYLSQKQISDITPLTFYPNPVDKNLTVDLQGLNAAPTTIWISNLLGQNVLSKKITSSVMTMDLSGLATGIYQIQILDKDRNLLSKGKLLKK